MKFLRFRFSFSLFLIERKKSDQFQTRYRKRIYLESCARLTRDIILTESTPMSGDTVDFDAWYETTSLPAAPVLTPRSDQPRADAKYPVRTIEYISFENLSHAKSSTKGNWIPVRGRDGMWTEAPRFQGRLLHTPLVRVALSLSLSLCLCLPASLCPPHVAISPSFLNFFFSTLAHF